MLIKFSVLIQRFLITFWHFYLSRFITRDIFLFVSAFVITNIVYQYNLQLINLIKMKSFEPNDGFFDLCVNVPDGGANDLNDILLRLYESKLIVRDTNKLINVFIILRICLVISGL